MPEYADPVIDWLDGGKGYFQKKLYRESCFLQSNGSDIKDLALVEKDLSRVCFMDNSPISYSWNKGESLVPRWCQLAYVAANALPVEGWTSDPNDEALLQSIPVLDSLRFVNDVRRVLGIRGFSVGGFT
jgi:CTD nuclear envelope phosphatase 1